MAARPPSPPGPPSSPRPGIPPTRPPLRRVPLAADGGGKAAAEWKRFYADPAVRRRHQEYLGGRNLESSPTRFVMPPSPASDPPARLRPVSELPALLASELEAARSLWDRRFLIAHLDIEHVHFDSPWEPLVYPKRSQFVQRGVVAAIRELLRGFGIEALHLLTGRGHHFVWKIDRRSGAFAALARLGTLDDAQRAGSALAQPPAGDVVGEALAAAWHGLGKVMEYFGHRILTASGPAPVPVQLTAVVVGPGAHGREIVAIDLSEYADPLPRRAMRLPFTAYLKAERCGWHPPPPATLPRLVAIPDPGDESEAIRIQREPELAAELARHTRTAIPEASLATEALVAAYEQSELAEFHRRYYAQEPDPPELWPATYDRIDTAALPACAARILAHPNDLLLQPGAMQLVVRVLLAQGWPPRHIAGLIRSKYERPYGWIAGVHFHDAAMRAEVYTRFFAGLVAVGNDQMIDLNCTSTQEKFLCPGTGCQWNLEALRTGAQGWSGRG